MNLGGISLLDTGLMKKKLGQAGVHSTIASTAGKSSKDEEGKVPPKIKNKCKELKKIKPCTSLKFRAFLGNNVGPTD